LSNEFKVVLWLSRQRPLPVQIEVLKEKLGNIILLERSRPIPTVDKALELIGKVNADYVIPVLPLTFVVRLVEESRKSKFVVIRPIMDLVHECSSTPCPDYDPRTDTLVETKDYETGRVFYRHYRFREFRILKEVQFVEEVL